MPKATSKIKFSQSRLSTFFNKASGPLQPQTTPSKQQNDSILNFFKKVDSPIYNERPLFVDGESSENFEDITKGSQHGLFPQPLQAEESRFNERDLPHKRRRTGSPPSIPLPPFNERAGDMRGHALRIDHASQTRDAGENGSYQAEAMQEGGNRNGPFAEDSESDQETNSGTNESRLLNIEKPGEAERLPLPSKLPLKEPSPTNSSKPTLTREAVSFTEDGFEGFEDFDGDEFYENGEEYLERRYMEEQAALERELEENDLDMQEVTQLAAESGAPATSESHEPSCPICNASLKDVASQV